MTSAPEIKFANFSCDDTDDFILSRPYINQSYTLMTDALQKGLDVAQLPNGDVMITEVKTVTYRYRWDQESKKFERYSASQRRKKRQTTAPANA